jgi:hypothetical protein
MDTITFEGKREALSLKDVDRFISENQGRKDSLIIEIDSAGIGDAFADRFEAAGFRVRRFTLRRVYSDR